MDLQSEKVDMIAPAFLAAQKVIKPAARDGKNKFLGSNYATLDSVWKVSKEAFHENDIMIIQAATPIDKDPYLICTLMHISGQFFRGAFPIPSASITTIANDAKKDKQTTEVRTDPQSLGSIIRYVRRYALASMAGVMDGDDDDGEGAQSQLESKEASLRRLILGVSDRLNAKRFQQTKKAWREFHKITGAQTGDEKQLKDLLKRVNAALKEQEQDDAGDPFTDPL